MNPFVGSADAFVVSLDAAGEVNALFHVSVLHDFKDDITLRLVGVKALIGVPIVILQRDDRVLSLCHLKIGFSARQRISLRTVGYSAAWKGIGVDGDEKVRLFVVGNVGAALKRNEYVRSPRIDNRHVRTVLLHESAKGEGDGEVDVFFFGACSQGAGVMSAVSGIDDQDKFLGGGIRVGRKQEKEQKSEKENA